jgi:hypothetical protein
MTPLGRGAKTLREVMDDIYERTHDGEKSNSRSVTLPHYLP